MNLINKFLILFTLAQTIIACGGISNQSSVDFSENAPVEITEDVDLSNANEIIPTAESNLVALKNIKLGQVCDISSYSQGVLNRTDLKYSGEKLALQIFKNDLIALIGSYPTDSIVRQLQNNSFLDSIGRLNHSLFQTSVSKNISGDPVCTIQTAGLRQKLLSGNVDIKNLIQANCDIAEVHTVQSLIDTPDKQIIYDAIEELISVSDYKNRAIAALLPYKLVVVDLDILNSSYASVDLGLFKDSENKLNIVMPKADVQNIVSNWHGFTAFMKNSADDKRCDYEQILAAR